MENRKIKILVVDDEDIVLESLTRLFAEEGYETKTCPEAEEGFDAVLQGNFDLLLTDLKMPGVDGLKLIDASVTAEPDMPIIVLTAYPSVDSAIKVMRMGAVDYIPKPFVPEQLLESVRGALKERSRRLKKNFRDQVFVEVRKSIASTLNLHKVFDYIVSGVIKGMQAKAAALSMYDGKQRIFRLMNSSGISRDYLARQWDESSEMSQSVADRKPHVIENMQHSVEPYAQIAQREGIGSALSLPLVVGDRVIGVLQVFDSQNSAFNREETEYLKSFSEEAVLQIQNARKFDDVKNEFDVLRDDLWEYLDKLDWE